MSKNAGLKLSKHQAVPDGRIYALTTHDNYALEVTEKILPPEEMDGQRIWSLGISCMSGCPVRCGFCATGRRARSRLLSAAEMTAQIGLLRQRQGVEFLKTHKMKVAFLAMGEPFLNLAQVKPFIYDTASTYPETEFLIATIGIKGSDYSWIMERMTLQLSVHSLHEQGRRRLIPYDGIMTVDELSMVRLPTGQKVVVEFTFVNEEPDMQRMLDLFPLEHFTHTFSLLNPIDGL